jgi:hypothetical protein
MPLLRLLISSADRAFSRAQLACGHDCPSKCHRIVDHSKTPCEKILSDKCPEGHQFKWICRQGKPVGCIACDRARKALERKIRAEFDLQEKRDREAQEHAEKMAELEAKFVKEAEVAKDLALAEERRRALIQKAKDLQDAATRNAHQRTTSQSNPANRPQNTVPPATGNQPPGGTTQPPPTSNTNLPSTTSTPQAPSSNVPSTPTAMLPKSSRYSEAETDWARQKSVEGAQSDAIDALMGMIGLEKVKQQVLDIKAKVDAAKRQGVPHKDRYNLALLGNPGTGMHSYLLNYSPDVLT